MLQIYADQGNVILTVVPTIVMTRFNVLSIGIVD